VPELRLSRTGEKAGGLAFPNRGKGRISESVQFPPLEATGSRPKVGTIAKKKRWEGIKGSS